MKALRGVLPQGVWLGWDEMRWDVQHWLFGMRSYFLVLPSKPKCWSGSFLLDLYLRSTIIIRVHTFEFSYLIWLDTVLLWSAFRPLWSDERCVRIRPAAQFVVMRVIQPRLLTMISSLCDRAAHAHQCTILDWNMPCEDAWTMIDPLSTFKHISYVKSYSASFILLHLHSGVFPALVDQHLNWPMHHIIIFV